MKSLGLLTLWTAIALASATAAFAADDPLIPNCNQGVKGCNPTAPTAEISRDGPKQKADAANPNCSPGEKGCTANYPTSDAAKKNPLQPQK